MPNEKHAKEKYSISDSSAKKYETITGLRSRGKLVSQLAFFFVFPACSVLCDDFDFFYFFLTN